MTLRRCPLPDVLFVLPLKLTSYLWFGRASRLFFRRAWTAWRISSVTSAATWQSRRPVRRDTFWRFQPHRLLNPVKWLLPRGRAPRTVQFGPLEVCGLHLDLRAEFLIWLGTYEAETFADLRRLLRGCRGAVDLGAAKGDSALHFLRQPEMQRVVTVEPLDREREQLAANLALNDRTDDPRLHFHAGFAGRGEPPLWRTLDDLAAEVPAPLFIKIDIDGPEAEVLADGRETLRTRDCRLLIETHSPEAETGCITQLRELGYTVKIISPAWWRIFVPELRPIPHNRWLAAWRDPLA